MAKTGLLRLAAFGESCVWLSAALAVSMTVAGCPHTRLAWGVFAFGFVWAVRYGFSGHVLREVNDTKRRVAAVSWEEYKEAVTRKEALAKQTEAAKGMRAPPGPPPNDMRQSGPTPEGPQTVEELVQAAMVGKGGAD